MRGDFLRIKADFMIFITVCSIFAIYFAGPAAAETAGTQEQLGCCADAKNTGEHCVMTAESECESAATGFTPASCGQTSYCKAGCCVSLDGGCSAQVGRATCQALEGYSWQDSANCEIPQCQKGCCILGGAQCFYTTEKRCNRVTSEYEELAFDFRTAIGTEYDCLNVCKQQDEGCCVTEEGKGTFTARASCPTREYDPSTGIGFFKDTFCSNENLDTGCEAHAKQDCIEGKEEVFWFDSCGNREEIVTATIEGSQNDAQNGDCDYATGTICGHDKKGKAICKDLNCAAGTLTFYDNINYLFQGKDRSNGESWCMYDAKPGVGADPVGSKHYRFMCINGEEVSAPCADARQEICKNGLINGVPFASAGDIIEAQCIPNAWKECVTSCNSVKELSDVNSGEYKSAMRKDRACCKQKAPNCFWLDWAEEEDVGRCYPAVSPGGKFWQGDSATIQEEPACDLATQAYKTAWEETFRWRGDFKCAGNCEVYTDDYLTLFNNYCNSLGDCGAQYNFQGIWTYDGLYRTWDVPGEDTVEIGSKEYTASNTMEKDPWNSWTKDPSNDHARLNVAEGLLSYSVSYDYIVGLLKDEFGDTSLGPSMWGARIAGGIAGLGLIVSYFGAATAIAVNLGALGTLTALGYGSGAAFSAGSVASIEANAMASSSVLNGAFYVSWGAAIIGTAMIVLGGWKGDRALMQTGIYVAAAGSVGLASVAIATCTTMCATGVGAIAAAVIVVAAWGLMETARTQERTVTAECAPWQPPTKGYDCESCDADPMKQCSEYRCKAIGQNCAFIPENEGTNRGTCYNANPDDVNSPRITDRSAIITSHKQDISQNFQLVPTETTSQVTGFKITPNVPPYSRVTVGIKTNEMSQCKIGQELPQGKAPYGVLPNYMPDSYYDMQHNYTIAGIVPEKEYHYYISCQDPSGNSQATVYGISFTADQGNDITPPQITGASLKDNAYVAAGVNETLLAIYVDEQSRLECKWSREDKDFNFMENNMSCASVPLEATSPRPAECGASMQLYEKNSRYYFRCRDYPMEYAGGAPTGNVLSPNVMQQSFSLNLQKSDALILQQTAPSGRLYTNNVTMQARTQQGAEAGKAVCYYNDIMFANTNSSYHEQTLSNLPTNDYKYSIECVDIAGNIAEGNISFSIDVDTAAPSIIGIHKSGNELKIITDEPTKCQYSNSSFSYGMGTAMLPDNSAEHSTSAAMPKYHIVCADMFNNRMPEVKIVLFESIS